MRVRPEDRLCHAAGAGSLPEKQSVDWRTADWAPGSDRGCDNLLDTCVARPKANAARDEARAWKRATQMEQIRRVSDSRFGSCPGQHTFSCHRYDVTLSRRGGIPGRIFRRKSVVDRRHTSTASRPPLDNLLPPRMFPVLPFNLATTVYVLARCSTRSQFASPVPSTTSRQPESSTARAPRTGWKSLRVVSKLEQPTRC